MERLEWDLSTVQGNQRKTIVGGGGERRIMGRRERGFEEPERYGVQANKTSLGQAMPTRSIK
jgi:hypothetical protein